MLALNVPPEIVRGKNAEKESARQFREVASGAVQGVPRSALQQLLGRSPIEQEGQRLLFSLR